MRWEHEACGAFLAVSEASKRLEVSGGASNPLSFLSSARQRGHVMESVHLYNLLFPTSCDVITGVPGDGKFVGPSSKKDGAEILVPDVPRSQATRPGSRDQRSLGAPARASRPEDASGGRPSGPGALCLSRVGPRGRCNLSGALRANISCFSPAPFLPTSRFSPVFARIFVRAGLTLPTPLLDASGKQLFTLTHVVTPLTATLPRTGAVWDAQRLERGRGSTGRLRCANRHVRPGASGRRRSGRRDLPPGRPSHTARLTDDTGRLVT